MVKWNVLDFSFVDEGVTVTEAIHQTVELAQLADTLGFHRFWMAEHHNVPALSNSSPEVAIAHLANHTQRIRLGSGGIMLPHYRPLKVAEWFRTLVTYYPHRIDLGIGNNIGTELVQQAMKTTSTEHYADDLQALYQYLTTQEGCVIANPVVDECPPMWLLSASQRSCQLAAQQGCGLVYGPFFNVDPQAMDNGVTLVEHYRQHFQPSRAIITPHVMLALFVLITEDDTTLAQLEPSTNAWLLGKNDFAYFTKFPSYETATAYKLTDSDRAHIAFNQSRMIIGTMAQAKAQLDTLIARYQADEVLLMPIMYGIDNRKKLLQLIADTYL